jgi:hypothetical protein
MIYIAVFLAGFVVGALVFRKNSAKGDAAVSWGKVMLDNLKNRAK